jgi:hypothetical protein
MMRVDRGGIAQLFWSTATSVEREENGVRWQLGGDGQFHEYVIDLSANENWNGGIEALRLAPTNIPRAEIAIDYPRLEK